MCASIARLSDLRAAERELARRSPAGWAEAHVKLEDGADFSFEGHEYLREPFTEHHPYTVFEKCTQVGISTFALSKAFWACDTLGLKVLYYFPTAGDVTVFSQTRAKPMIEASEYLRGKVADLDNVGVRRIGSGFLYFKGMKTGASVKATPGDFLIFDELDEADPVRKQEALYRLSHSSYRWVLELSNPTYPEYGIDIEFQRSDQRYWLVRCARCNTDNCLEDEFPGNIVAPDDLAKAAYVACRKCRKPLDVEAHGRWVPRAPGIKDRRGYHMCQLMTPRAQLREMLRKFHSTDPLVRTAFLRMDMGMPYVEGTAQIGEQEVKAAVRAYGQRSGMRKRSCTMGVDVGTELHVQISTEGPDGQRRAVRICTVTEFETLDRFMQVYNVTRCVVDAMPDLRAARQFARRHEGRVWLCHYVETPGPPTFNDRKLSVNVNRTESLDGTLALFRAEPPMLELPNNCDKIDEYAKHFHNLVKEEIRDDETGKVVWRYVRKGPDHFAHAANYDRIAWDDHVEAAAEDVDVDADTYRRSEYDDDRPTGWGRSIFGR